MPVTPTYDLIASNVLSTQSDAVTFSSISGSYRDLILVGVVKTASSGGPSGNLRFNSDSGSNYNYVEMRGNGSTTGSQAGNTTFVQLGSSLYISNDFTYQFLAQIMDYSATDKHKTVLVRSNQTVDPFNSGVGTYAIANRWASTSAITSITINVYQAVAGSSFYLYGLVS